VNNAGQILVSALAIAGGAALVAVLTSATVGFGVRRLFRKPLPPAARTLLRVLGGITGGLTVALLLFSGFGGGGWGFGGSGAGSGNSRGDLTTANSAAARPDTTANSKPTLRSTAPTVQIVRVVMLGGDLVRNGAAYRIEGERQPRTLADLKQVIQQRMAAEPPAKVVDIIIYDNSVARGSAPVEDLERWARQSGLMVIVIATPGEIPP
jgi:hypothetical protein